MEFEGRKVIFKSLVGSHNYNLNTPKSDKDYKVVVLPNYDDIYFSKSLSKNYESKTEDISAHDIRKYTNSLYKSNINFIEGLFSDNVIINCDFDSKSMSLIEEYFSLKDEIASLNLAHLYKSSSHMYLNKLKNLKVKTGTNDELIDMFGYNTKSASTAWRILDFLIRYGRTNFSDFKKAIWYVEEDRNRNFYFELKNGEISFDEFCSIVEEKYNEVEGKWRDIYLSKPVHEYDYERVVKIVKELVRFNI